MNPNFKADAVVIGCSAGGVDALCSIFEALPKDFKLPIVVVIHLPSNSASFFKDCFGARTSLPVKEADEKEPLLPGTIYFAPPDHHLLIESDRTLSLSREGAVNFSRPSIDVLFESAGDCFGSRLLAVVLTGANDDGAMGAKYIHERGGAVLVQSPETASYQEMPVATLKTGINAIVKNIEEIAKIIGDLG